MDAHTETEHLRHLISPPESQVGDRDGLALDHCESFILEERRVRHLAKGPEKVSGSGV